MQSRYLMLGLLTACAGHLRTEVVGNGAVTVQPRASAPASTGEPAPSSSTQPTGGVQLARGTYDLQLHFDLPSAQVIDWTVTCAGVDDHGSIGESFESYRTRRLADLRARREQERRRLAEAAAKAQVQAQAQAQQPSSDGQPGYPQPPSTGQQASYGQPGYGPGTVQGGAVTGTVQVGVQTPVGTVQVGGQGYTQGTPVRDHRTPPPAGTQGYVPPPGTAQGYVPPPGTPQGNVQPQTAQVDVQVSGQVVGDANAGTTVLPDIVELPPGDVGAGHLQARVHVSTNADGMCTVNATADDPTIRATFVVTRLRDLDAEARVRVMAATGSARQVRGQITAQLAAYGADPDLRKRERAAEARARYEAEMASARLRAELQIQAETKANAEYVIEVRRRQTALEARAMLLAYLEFVGGADPHYRERLRAEARAKREAREAEIRIRIEQRRAEDAARARARAQRTELALGVRAQLRAYLVGIGARERPPMPAPLPENPGAPPFDGAVWVTGVWHWTGGQWAWTGGGWRDTTRFGSSGTAGNVVNAIDTIIDVGTAIDSGVRDHRTNPPPADTTVRDHRTNPPASEPTVRDHRTSPPASEPTVRDHRTSSPSPQPQQPPVVRDHRKDDDKKDEKPTSTPTVRDHRKR